jgi:hypothetical protein
MRGRPEANNKNIHAVTINEFDLVVSVFTVFSSLPHHFAANWMV